MSKRLLFIGVVVLVLSSMASASVWGWWLPFDWPYVTPSGSGNVTGVVATNGASNLGPGPSSRTAFGGVSSWQVSPYGVQSSNIGVYQSSSVTSTSPGAVGVARSVAVVTTSQYQGSR